MKGFPPRDPIERFLEKVDKTSNPNGCWEWTGCIDRGGYGNFKGKSKGYLAHRFSAEFIAKLSIDGKMVCHTCDNRKCVNPAHFFIGDALANKRDMIKKGRQRHYTVPVETSLGKFNSIVEAAKAHNKHTESIRYLLKKGKAKRL